MANSHDHDREDSSPANDAIRTYAYDSNGWLTAGGPEVSKTFCTYEYDLHGSDLPCHKPNVLVQLKDGTLASLTAYLAGRTEAVVVLCESPIPPIDNRVPGEDPKPGADSSDPESDVPTIMERPRLLQ